MQTRTGLCKPMGNFKVKNLSRVILSSISQKDNERSSRRSNTLTQKSVHNLLGETGSLQKIHKSPEIIRKTIRQFNYSSTASFKLMPLKLKSRFKEGKFSNKRIPQDSHLVFLLDKIPTFDIARAKNIHKSEKKLLKLIRPILEDQNE